MERGVLVRRPGRAPCPLFPESTMTVAAAELWSMIAAEAALELAGAGPGAADFASAQPRRDRRTSHSPALSTERAEHLPPSDPDECQWILAARCGDSDAFARIIRNHQRGVAHALTRFSRDQTQIEELTQEVFVQVWRSLHGYRGEAPLAHWIQRITTRVGCRFWRGESRRRRLRQVLSLLGGTDEARQDDSEEARATALLARLGDRDRLVLLLLHVEQRSVKEISVITGWSEALVKVQAHRARKRLRALLEESP